MKALSLLMILAVSCSAQNVAVRFCGTNNVDGLPAYWPAAVASCGIQKSVPGYEAVMTWAEMSKIISTNRAAWQAAEASRMALERAKEDAEAAKVAESVKQLQSTIGSAKATLTVCSNVSAALAIGKLTQEQLSQHIEALADVLRIQLEQQSACLKTQSRVEAIKTTETE